MHLDSSRECFLLPENYQKILERMKEKGFRYGFACLFYGSPGTGKTETVYQLAKKTGRNIMVVDVPQLKSMWVGQSEKNVKALFDRYREQVKKAKLTPILLFNQTYQIHYFFLFPHHYHYHYRLSLYFFLFFSFF